MVAMVGVCPAKVGRDRLGLRDLALQRLLRVLVREDLTRRQVVQLDARTQGRRNMPAAATAYSASGSEVRA